MRSKFRVKLHADEKWVLCKLYNLDKPTTFAAYDKSIFFIVLFVAWVCFKAVSVSLFDAFFALINLA